MPNAHDNETVVSAESYSTPVKCPHCGADAHLMHRQEAGGGHEVRVFECVSCKLATKIIVTP